VRERPFLAALSLSALAAALVVAQSPAPPPGRVGGARAGGAGRGGASHYPTAEQWAAMPDSAKGFVDKARALAGDDPDLQFDFGVFCAAGGGASNPERAAIGVPNSEPRLQPFPAPTPPVVLGGQRLFDNFYWIGSTGIGAWLITSNDGYILFDAMNSEDDARDIIIPAIAKLNLDPMKIRYLVFGHHHFDHTGGGAYIQRLTGAKAIMGRDDWAIYLRAPARGGGPPPARMTRDLDAIDGMTITVGRGSGAVTATIFQMTGHTPGSIGMVVPVRYQGANHPILLITAGSDVPNRESFIGGYEHIWDKAIAMKVESVMQSHPNTNMNLLARTKYVHEHYPPAKHPLLYGAARSERYLNIVRACTQARLEILGW
jgi:metallo-beta-lactamase class B